MKDNVKAMLAIIGIIVFVFGFIGYGCWSDSNGVRVYTDEPRDREVKATSQSFNIPIEVRCRIEYDNDFIVTKDTIVEFCDVKETKKLMKREMKVYWKEMRKGCK